VPWGNPTEALCHRSVSTPGHIRIISKAKAKPPYQHPVARWPCIIRSASPLSGVVWFSFTFKKGYEFDKPFIARFSFPQLQGNSIFRVSCHVFWMHVKLCKYVTSVRGLVKGIFTSRTMMTQSSGLLRYDKSFTGPFSVLRVALWKSLYIIKKLYGSSFSRIAIAVYHIVQ
jgi:hypothetical protein